MSDTAQPSFEQFAEIISEKLAIPYAQIKPEVAMRDIEIDSLALLEVMLAAETKFGVTIPTDDVSADGTVEDMYKMVLEAVSGSRL